MLISQSIEIIIHPVRAFFLLPFFFVHLCYFLGRRWDTTRRNALSYLHRVLLWPLRNRDMHGKRKFIYTRIFINWQNSPEVSSGATNQWTIQSSPVISLASRSIFPCSSEVANIISSRVIKSLTSTFLSVKTP